MSHMAMAEGAVKSGATSSEPRCRILLVEDDDAIRALLDFHLDLAGFDRAPLSDGGEALREASRQSFDLAIIDVMIPTIDGITLCKALRRAGPNRDIPILMLTARAEESDKVLGLESGADDYLTKPFSIRELLARLDALMRRPKSTWRTPHTPVISKFGITVDVERHRVTRDNQPVQLTPHEFALLQLLLSHPGIVFSRQELMKRVWPNDVNITLRGVDTLVKRLRRKIEPNSDHPRYVLTDWGTGYKFNEG